MAAGTYNMLCEQGATFAQILTWTDANDDPFDLTGYTAKMQVRSSKGASSLILELSTDNFRIAVRSNGNIELDIPSTVTSTIPSGVYVYDLELYFNGATTRLIEGSFRVNGEVTR